MKVSKKNGLNAESGMIDDFQNKLKISPSATNDTISRTPKNEFTENNTSAPKTRKQEEPLADSSKSTRPKSASTDDFFADFGVWIHICYV